MVEKWEHPLSVKWECEHCNTIRFRTYSAARIHELFLHDLSATYDRAVRYVQRWSSW